MRRINSVLAAIGSSLFVSQAAIAQQATPVAISGNVLGIEDGDAGCLIIIRLPETDDLQLVDVDEASLCEQVVVGQTIELTYSVTELEVLPPPEVATITELIAGDRACYATLTDAQGNTTNQLASFEICAQNILNAEVSLTYETGNVLAYACEGNPDCGEESEEAILITQAEPTGNPPTPPIPDPQPEPQPLISSLPDGNYRYWNGTPDGEIVSSDELLAKGGVYFLFNKRGQNVVGTFAYVDGEAICVQGQANENTVSGISVQRFPGATPISTGETFRPFGPSGRLNVRRGREIPSSSALVVDGRRVPIDVVRYDSTLLSLDGLTRINAGTRVPPSTCL